MDTPTVDGTDEVLRALQQWQHDGGPVQLHPGDVGWNVRFGADATAAALRTWRRDGRILAVGMVDSPGVVRFGVAPEAADDHDLALEIHDDLERHVLPDGEAAVEVRFGPALQQRLRDDGWVDDALWTPLVRDLAAPVEDCGLRIEVAGPEHVTDRVAVQRAAFPNSTFTEAAWQEMAAADAYTDARCLVAYDRNDDAVAVATVWSAGRGRPGLLEPVGVHRDHRGHRHGTAISLAAAAALQQMGASTATVCTPSANAAAVATYASAGYERGAPVPDLRRPATGGSAGG